MSANKSNKEDQTPLTKASINKEKPISSEQSNTNNDSENLNLLEIRKKQQLVDELSAALEKTSKEIVFLQETLSIEENRLKEVKNEYQLRYEYEEQLYGEIQNLLNSNSNEAHLNIIEIQKKTIRKELTNELLSRVTQLSKMNQGLVDQKNNAYYQLIFNNIKVNVFLNNNNANSIIYSLRITRRTSFAEIKKELIKILNLEEPITSFAITNEIRALIVEEDQTIDKYLRQYSVFSNNFNLEYLSNIKSKKSLLAIQESRLKENMTISREDRKKKGEEETDANFDYTERKIKDFNSDFPLLQQYQKDENKAKTLKPEKNSYVQAKNLETSFIMFVLLVLMFAFTLLAIYNNRDIGRSLIIKNYIKESFNRIVNSTTSNFESNDENLNSFSSSYGYSNVNTAITNQTSLFKYLALNIGFLFLNISENELNLSENTYFDPNKREAIEYNLDIENFTSDYPDVTLLNSIANSTRSLEFNGLILASSIKFVVKKVIQRKCDTSIFSDRTVIREIEDTGCFEPYYSESTAYKETFPSSDILVNTPSFEQFATYLSNKESNLEMSYSSLIGDYSGSGYHADIPKNATLASYLADLVTFIPVYQDFQAYNTDNTNDDSSNEFLESMFLYNKQNRAIVLLLTLYNPTNYYYYDVHINLIFLPTGIIYLDEVDVSEFVFKLYKFNANVAADTIRFILIVILILLVGYNFYNKVILNKQSSPLEFFKKKKTITSMFLIIFYLIIFFVKVVKVNSSADSKVSFQGESYYDTSSYSYNLSNAYLLECLLIILIVIKMLNFLELNDNVRIFYKSLFQYLKDCFFYAFFFIPIILIFSTIAYIVFGPYVEEFGNFNKAYLRILLLPIGGVNIAQWILANEFWAVLFCICYYFFLVFFCFIVFITLFTEKLRYTIVVRGYPSDNETFIWTTMDYLRWLCFFIDFDKKDK